MNCHSCLTFSIEFGGKYVSYEEILDKVFAIIISKESFIMSTKFSIKRYSSEFKSSIVSLHKTGYSANSLAREYNASVSAVTKWINQDNPNNTKVLSDNEQALIKGKHRLK